MSCPAAQAYANACTRERTDIAPEIIDALNMGDRECAPSNGRPLVDADLRCIAEALRMPHGLRCLSLEENAFGLDGVSAILDALSVNPGTLLELRLGKNKLKDPSVISIANTIMTTPLGLKVIDLGDNGITKLGCEALCNALVSKECSLIEVSLHSNQLEADSGIALAKAIRSAILKHLHLGYNQLRDAGATQLARCIPITSTLTTLDLTSNRIGPQGGQELARALMSATCTLQRINLRHNNFDNETIQLFSEVLLRNTSLTQLFLGFMNPSPETAAMVLTSLRQNRTLLLLDIYGWKLDLDTTGRVIEDVMFHNNVVRAITSDACQPIYHTIDKHNQERDSRGLHEIYIGPDDRHSAKAAFVKNSSSSRGASRSQQPGSSPQAQRVVSPQRGGSQQVQAQHPPARGPHDSQNNSMQARTASPQPAARGSQPSSVNNRQQSQQQQQQQTQQQQQQQQQQQPRQVAVVQPVSSRGQQSPAQNSANSRQQPQPMQASDRQSSPNSRAASQSNRGAAAPQQQQQPAVAQQQQLSRAAPQQAAQSTSRAQPTASNGGTNNEDVKAIIAQMQGKMDAQQKQHDAKIAELEKRIRALEEGKEDKRKGGAGGGANSGMNTSRGGSPARVQPAASQQQQQGGQQPARGQQSPMDRSHQSAVAPASQSQRGQPQQGAQGDAFTAQPQQQSARGQQSPMNRSQQGQSQNNQSQPQYQEVVSRSYQQPQQSQQQPPQRASSSGRGAGQQQQPAANRAPLSAGGNQMQPFGAQRLGGNNNNNNNSAPNSASNRSTPQHRPDQQAQQQQPQRAGAGRPQPYDGGMIKSSSPQPRDGSSMSPYVERRATSEAVMDVPEDMLIGQHPAQSPAQPNEPSNIAEGSLPAPDLQPSFHEAPNARMESKPNDWPMQLPRRKAPPRSDV